MNKTGKTAVVSIYPGIGDIIWHLPFFRALAEKSEKKKIYLFTRQTTLAKEILEYEETIAKVYYLNETRKFLNTIHNFPKLLKTLKRSDIIFLAFDVILFTIVCLYIFSCKKNLSLLLLSFIFLEKLTIEVL